LNILLFEPREVGPSGAVTLAGARAAHLRDVLKVGMGQVIRIGVIDGPLGLATVEAATASTIGLSCRLDAHPPARPRVDLLLAVPRPKVMRRLWAQIAALGVGRVILTNAEKVERPYFDTHVLRPECYRPLLIEGLQQARDTRVPEVSVHRRLRVLVEDALDELAGPGLRLVADPSAQTTLARSIGSRSGLNPDTRLLLAVGPEGGWNEFELRLLEEHGFDRVGLGPRTLRTDTACLALLALAHDVLSRTT